MYPLWKCQFLAENVRLSRRRMWHKTMVRWVGLSQLGGLGWSHFFALSRQNSHGQGSDTAKLLQCKRDELNGQRLSF